MNEMGSEDALTWAVAIFDEVKNAIVEIDLWGRYGRQYGVSDVIIGNLERWYIPEMRFPHSLFGKNIHRRAAILVLNAGPK